jgi:hypothetical protein
MSFDFSVFIKPTGEDFSQVFLTLNRMNKPKLIGPFQDAIYAGFFDVQDASVEELEAAVGPFIATLSAAYVNNEPLCDIQNKVADGLTDLTDSQCVEPLASQWRFDAAKGLEKAAKACALQFLFDEHVLVEVTGTLSKQFVEKWQTRNEAQFKHK